MTQPKQFRPHRIIITQPGPNYGEAGTAIEYHDESPPWYLIELDRGVTVPVEVRFCDPVPDLSINQFR